MEALFIYCGIALVLGFVLGWLLNTSFGAKSLKEAKVEQKKLIEEGKHELEDLQRDLELKAKSDLIDQKQELENEFLEKQAAFRKEERKLEERELLFQKEKEDITLKEADLKHQQIQIDSEKQRANEMKQHYRKELDKVNIRLEEIAGLSKEKAIEELKENLVEEAQKQSSKIIQDIIAEAEENGQRKAKDIILQSIHETASDHSVESTVSIVNLPDDTMKGRIIGREGRNIRSFELNTGVDILIDDTPQKIVLSCFNPIRREIAKVALDSLIEDGRIHPGRIEEVVEKAKEEMDDRNYEAGEQALFELGIHGVHGDLVKQLGQLRFYSISGQNALKHSIEVAKIASIFATEMKLDIMLAKRASIFHEIGRVVERFEVPVLDRTIDLLKKYKESEQLLSIINEMFAPQTITHSLAYVLAASKSISSSRPGARREVYESYLKRLSNLEALCLEFDAVEKAFAIQTGREVRILVDTEQVEDQDTTLLAGKIASKIESKLEYPGQIKVTIFREFRSIDFAK